MTRIRFVALAALVAALVLPAATATAATVTTVTSGHSIQAAINAAPSGGTIVVLRGTYRENLLITKSVRLIGHGAILRPPANPTENPCSGGESGGTSATGICIFGQANQQGQVTATVDNVRVEGFSILGFGGMGIFAFGANNLTVRNNRLANNGDYGVFANTSSNTKILGNSVYGNGAPGIYIGDSPNANATVVGNSSYNNRGEGILWRDALGGRVNLNAIYGNCAGVLVVDTGAPGASGDVSIALNNIYSNNRSCPGEAGEAPPMGGLGVVLAGAQHTTVAVNVIRANVQQPGSGLPGGGVNLIDSTGFGGTAPTNNSVNRNLLSANSPNDLLTDGTGSGNTFTNNSCTTSTPAGNC
jgi:parallel beta-helix repeat protein